MRYKQKKYIWRKEPYFLGLEPQVVERFIAISKRGGTPRLYEPNINDIGSLVKGAVFQFSYWYKRWNTPELHPF